MGGEERNHVDDSGDVGGVRARQTLAPDPPTGGRRRRAFDALADELSRQFWHQQSQMEGKVGEIKRVDMEEAVRITEEFERKTFMRGWSVGWDAGARRTYRTCTAIYVFGMCAVLLGLYLRG